VTTLSEKRAGTTEVPKPLLTPNEFWEGLGRTVGRDQIYGALRAKRIRAIRSGRRILIPRTELTDWLVREAGLQE